jgi:hypothetical protein
MFTGIFCILGKYVDYDDSYCFLLKRMNMVEPISPDNNDDYVDEEVYRGINYCRGRIDWNLEHEKYVFFSGTLHTIKCIVDEV